MTTIGSPPRVEASSPSQAKLNLHVDFEALSEQEKLLKYQEYEYKRHNYINKMCQRWEDKVNIGIKKF